MDWIQFDRQRGLGVERQDTYLAQLLAMTFNVNRPERTDPLTPKDFIFWHHEEQAPQITADELKRKLGFA